MPDLTIIIIGIIATLIAAISKSGFAGGGVMVTVPLLAVFVGPTQAAAILLPTLVLMDAFSLKIYWRGWDWNILKPLLIAGAIGVGLGWLLYRYVDERALKTLIAILALAFSAYLLFGNRIQRDIKFLRYPYPWGILAGFTSFSVHAGGPPVNVHLLSLKLDKRVFQSTSVALFAFINILKMPSYFALGIFTQVSLTFSAFLCLFVPLGIWIGYRINTIISESLYFKIIVILLVAAGIKLGLDALLMGG